MIENKITYRPIKQGGYYIILVTRRSSLADMNEVRVSLFEEDCPHDTEIFDLNLQRLRHRRILEQYVMDIQKQVHLKGVYFGTTDCGDAIHYTLETFKERYSSFRDMDYLNDIHLNINFN